MSDDKRKELEKQKINIFSRISIAVFMIVLIIPGLVWGIGMMLSGDNFKALDYDLGEKRDKAEFPHEFTSAYGTEIEAYYNDRLPFRSVIITANRKLTWAMEKPYEETISPYLVKLLYSNDGEEQLKAEAEITTDSEVKADVEITPDDDIQTTPESQSEDKEQDTENVEETEEAEETEETEETEEIETNQTEPDNAEDVAKTDNVEDGTDNTETDNTESDNNTEESEEEPEPRYILNDADPNYLPPKIYNNQTLAGRDGWLFYANQNALDDYVANNILSNSQMNSYLSGMVNLQQVCTSLGKKVYFIIPPNKEQVYAENMPSYVVNDSYKRAQRLVDYVQANSDIKIVYPIGELQAAKAAWQTYFKTDTHWTELGAYIGVQALYGIMGIPTTDLQSLAVTNSPYLGGDLVLLGNLNQEKYADDIRYHIGYKPDISVSSVDGSVFIDNIYRTTSTSSNPAKVVLVGDSFRLFMAEYLSRDFSSYTHIYRDNIEDPVAVEAIKNADIIIIESVERFNGYMPGIMSKVSGVLQQQ